MRAVAKFHWRAGRWNPFLAFVTPFFEALLTLTLLRLLYRSVRKLLGFPERARFPDYAGPAVPAAESREPAVVLTNEPQGVLLGGAQPARAAREAEKWRCVNAWAVRTREKLKLQSAAR